MNKDEHLEQAVLLGLIGFLAWFSIHTYHYHQTIGFESRFILAESIETRSVDATISILLLFPLSKLGGRLPDIIEPPGGRHRSFWHSWLLLFVMTIVSLFILATISINFFNLPMNSIPKKVILWAIYFLLLGYISHLLSDSLTPIGLK